MDKYDKYIGLQDFESLLRTFRAAQRVLGVGLHAAECMDANTMDAVVRNLHFRNPLAQRHPFYLLIEGGGSRATELQQNVRHEDEDDMTHEFIVLTDSGRVRNQPNLAMHTSILTGDPGDPPERPACVVYRFCTMKSAVLRLRAVRI